MPVQIRRNIYVTSHKYLQPKTSFVEDFFIINSSFTQNYSEMDSLDLMSPQMWILSCPDQAMTLWFVPKGLSLLPHQGRGRGWGGVTVALWNMVAGYEQPDRRHRTWVWNRSWEKKAYRLHSSMLEATIVKLIEEQGKLTFENKSLDITSWTHHQNHDLGKQTINTPWITVISFVLHKTICELGMMPVDF